MSAYKDHEGEQPRADSPAQLDAPSFSSSSPTTTAPAPATVDAATAEKDVMRDMEKEGGGSVVPPEPEAFSPPHSVFSSPQKWFVVFVVALTTLLPPLTASIFYPVITLLAKDLDVSITEINLTITVYLIVQGIAPSFVGNLSDVKGRRPALLISLAIYIAGSIGAAVKSNYGLLFAMRCLQSAGGSGTIALSLATVSDIVTSAERGMYTSYVQMGWMLGPSLGPIIGGLISKYLGWQAIFWFLAIYAGAVWIIAFFFLPETSRHIVGNGSIPPTRWNMTGSMYIKSLLHVKRHSQQEQTTPTTLPAKSTSLSAINPLRSLQLFADKESCLLLIYSGLIYASTYMILSTLPDQLEIIYGFDTLTISLCFLASGFGTVTSVLLTGRILDWNFSRHARLSGLTITKNKQQDLRGFPLERARLESSITTLIIGSVCMICYGWTLQTHTNLAAPLIFLFFQSFGGASAFSGMNNLIMDLNRERPGVASAAMNLTRCWLGAGGTAFASPLVTRPGAGVGWLCVVIPGIWLVFSPFLVIVWRCGPRWREEKRVKLEKKKEEEAGVVTAENSVVGGGKGGGQV